MGCFTDGLSSAAWPDQGHSQYTSQPSCYLAKTELRGFFSPLGLAWLAKTTCLGHIIFSNLCVCIPTLLLYIWVILVWSTVMFLLSIIYAGFLNEMIVVGQCDVYISRNRFYCFCHYNDFGTCASRLIHIHMIHWFLNIAWQLTSHNMDDNNN